MKQVDGTIEDSAPVGGVSLDPNQPGRRGRGVTNWTG